MNIKASIIDIAKKNDLFRKILRSGLYTKNSIKNFTNKFTKVDEKLVIFETFMGRAYDCTPRAIYEYMLEDPAFKDFKFIWAFKEPVNDFIEKPLKMDPRTTIVSYRSKEYYRYYGIAKFWITNSRLPEEIKKKSGQIYIQCWHGTPLKRLGHDVVENTQNAMNNKQEIDKRYDTESFKFDYFISPSDFASEKFKSAFGINNDKIVQQGYPRNDSLFNHSEKDIMELKKQNGIPLDKKVIFYTPTFRDDQHQSGLGYTLDIYADFDYLMNELKDEYVIIFRPHYLVANKMDLTKYKGFVYYDKSFMSNTNDLYLMSDILVTDYSSAFFDYANLNKPMIFYMYDLEHYKDELRGFYIKLSELPGEIVLDDRSLVKRIKNIEKYNKKYATAYNKFNAKYNYLDDGQAAKRVVDQIIKKEVI